MKDSTFDDDETGDGDSAFDQTETFPPEAAPESLARVHLTPDHYLTGLVEGDTFHPHDEVSSGKSYVALTGQKAPYKPMKLSSIEAHGARLEYVVTR